MGEKVDVVMISKRAGHKYLIKGYGDRVYLEYNDTDINPISQTAVFHAKYFSKDSRANWYTVNLWTGLFISDGTTRKRCMEEFETKRAAYISMLNNPERTKFFQESHEELEKLKTQAISQ